MKRFALFGLLALLCVTPLVAQGHSTLTGVSARPQIHARDDSAELMRFSADYARFSVDAGRSWHPAAALRAAYAESQEIVTLTTPQTQTATTCTVQYLGLDLVNSRITVQAALNTGGLTTKTYDATTTPTGATLLHSLNIGNFSINSLMKAVYNRLSTDGVCAGTVTGTPQH